MWKDRHISQLSLISVAMQTEFSHVIIKRNIAELLFLKNGQNVYVNYLTLNIFFVPFILARFFEFHSL